VGLYHYEMSASETAYYKYSSHPKISHSYISRSDGGLKVSEVAITFNKMMSAEVSRISAKFLQSCSGQIRVHRRSKQVKMAVVKV
jgi:hypothetical protein